MGLEEIWGRARDVMTVERVFGEPIEKDGLTIIPVAAIRGGGGGGGGQGLSPGGEDGEGFGGGFGVTARPVGVFVIKDGKVEWEEAVDGSRSMAGWQTLATVGLFTLASMFRQRAKTKRRRG